jgi:DNA-binding NtrC family response regulator
MTASALTTATSGYECLATLARTRPRLVVLDESAIEPEGLTLLRMLHQRDPEVLIVYLTTHHTVELERAVRQSGVLYYTEKPPDSSLLSKVVASVFAPGGEARHAPWVPRCRRDLAHR